MTRTITQEELNEILEKHKKWLNDEPGGECANLSHCDLSNRKLGCRDLRNSILSDCDLRDSDLSGCSLRGSDLSNSNLRGCNLDFACLPLWCGSLSAHFDDRQIAQIVYHAVKAGLASPNVSDEVKAELRKVIPLANRFHRTEECGVIEE